MMCHNELIILELFHLAADRKIEASHHGLSRLGLCANTAVRTDHGAFRRWSIQVSRLNFQSSGLLLRRIDAQAAQQTAEDFGRPGCGEAVFDHS